MNRVIPTTNAALFLAIALVGWRLRAEILTQASRETRRTIPGAQGSGRDPELPRAAAPRVSPGPEKVPGPAGEPGDVAKVLDILDRMIRTHSEKWSLGRELLRLDPDAVLAGIRERWEALADPELRFVVLRTFHQIEASIHPPLFDLLDLYLADPDPGTRAMGAESLRVLVLHDFEYDPDGYRRWRERTRGLADEDLWRVVASDFLNRARATGPAEFAAGALDLDAAQRSPAWRLLRTDALRTYLEGWIASANPEAVHAGLDLAKSLYLDEEFLRRNIAPFLGTPAFRREAIRVFGDPRERWAAKSLLPFLRDPDPQVVEETARSLCAIGDPAHFPVLLEVISQSGDPGLNELLTSWGLCELANLRPHASHNAAWWAAWWTENGERLLREDRERLEAESREAEAR